MFSQFKEKMASARMPKSAPGTAAAPAAPATGAAGAPAATTAVPTLPSQASVDRTASTTDIHQIGTGSATDVGGVRGAATDHKALVDENRKLRDRLEMLAEQSNQNAMLKETIQALMAEITDLKRNLETARHDLTNQSHAPPAPAPTTDSVSTETDPLRVQDGKDEANACRRDLAAAQTQLADAQARIAEQQRDADQLRAESLRETDAAHRAELDHELVRARAEHQADLDAQLAGISSKPSDGPSRRPNADLEGAGWQVATDASRNRPRGDAKVQAPRAKIADGRWPPPKTAHARADATRAAHDQARRTIDAQVAAINKAVVARDQGQAEVVAVTAELEKTLGVVAAREGEVAQARAELARMEKEFGARVAALEAEIVQAHAEAAKAHEEMCEMTARHHEVETQLASAKGKHHNVETQLGTTKDALRNAEAQVVAANDKYRDAEAQLGAAKDKNQALEAQLASAKDQHRALEPQLAAAKDHSRGLETQLIAAKDRSHALETQLAAAKGQYQETETQLKTTKDKLHDVETQLATEKSKRHEVESQLATGEGKARDLQTKVEQLEKAKLAADQNYQLVEGQLQRALQASTDLQTQLDAAVADRAKLTTDVQRVTKEQEVIEHQVRNTQAVAQELQDKWERTESARNDAERAKKRLEQQVKDAVDATETWKFKHDALEKVVQQAELARRDAEAVSGATKIKLADLDLAHTALKEQLETTRRQLEVAGQLGRAETERVAKLDAGITELRQQLTVVQAQVAEGNAAKADLEVLRSSQARTALALTESEAELKALRSTEAGLRRQLRELQLDYSEAKEFRDQHEQTLSQLRAQVADLMAARDQAQAALPETAAKALDLERHVAELQAANDDFESRLRVQEKKSAAMIRELQRELKDRRARAGESVGDEGNGTGNDVTILSHSNSKAPSQYLPSSLAIGLSGSHATDEEVAHLHDRVAKLTAELESKSKLLQQYILKDNQGVLEKHLLGVQQQQKAATGGGLFSSSPSTAAPRSGVSIAALSSTSALQKMDHSLLVEVTVKLQALLEEQTLKAAQLQEDVAVLKMELARFSSGSGGRGDGISQGVGR
ncbi:hypothetical protein AMAG_03369 [Allomyces macrogynus ATCC 38327]|uniref:Uncharacterized protein n=1 Tax=Allomyces macrogynus (strain ATCC 38327) TaxID=578462 RepID=A0A0L0S9F0_ALLM3|nr:hypothetical protein AMAG_03369 [Allomyces macrogynus ATCC 38327]|eukprot:KNE59019.1 hypothetical protein AMAG_03369 [Allomyces macrogynus ATCC 38327]